jgi:hypothetical protein
MKEISGKRKNEKFKTRKACKVNALRVFICRYAGQYMPGGTKMGIALFSPLRYDVAMRYGKRP